MKKFFLTMVFMLLPIQFVFADEFTEDLPVIDVSVQKINGKAVFDNDNLYSFGSSGDPMLPVYFVRFILPDTADESSVVLTVDDPQVIETPEVFDVDPVPPECNDMACVDVYWPNPENIDENGRNANKYSLGDYINNTWIADYSVSSYKSMKIVTVEMFSHDWNPSTGKIKKLTGGVLNLAYSNNSSGNNYINVSHFSPNNVENIAFFLNNSVNGSELIVKNEFGNEYLLPELNSYLFNYYNNYPLFYNVFTQQSKKNSLYIISTNNIVMNSRVLGRYIKSKIRRNFDVTVVTEDKTFINGLSKSINYGWEKAIFTQKADMIRNYLTAGKRYENIDYLLLVGDPHPGGCGSTSGYDYYNGFGGIDINDDCKFDGTNEGSVPMKWINLYASSTKTSYSRGGDNFIDSDDLRRALPSDKYYSVLSIDWPVDTDGNTGDGSNAKFYRTEVQKNDLILGRIPVYNNDVSDLDAYLNKVIRYENNLRSSVDSWRQNVFAPLDYWDTGSMPNHIDDTPVWEFGERLKSEIINSNSNYSVSLMLRGDSFNHTYTKGVDPDPMHGVPFIEKCSPIKFDIGINDVFYREITDCVVVAGGDETCNTPADIIQCTVTLHYEEFFPTEHDDFGDMGLSFNLATIENRWNAGYGATIISSHGGVIGGLSEFNLDDYYSGHVFIGACRMGWPENKDILSKRLLENGAMTTIAAGRWTILNRTKFIDNNGVFELSDFESSDENDRWSINQMSLEYAKFLAQDFITSGKAFSKSFTELFFNVNARNYLLYNFYGDPAIGPMTWKESGSDIDNDGVIDSFDNCPGLENILQTDSDGDGVGDACDNCSVPNGWEINNSEIVVAPCDSITGVGGANCFNLTKDHVYRDINGDYYWQPDHDLDGEGDACDPDTNVWTSFPRIPLSRSYKKEIINTPILYKYEMYPNTYLSATIEMESNKEVSDSYTSTNRFCWLTPDEFSSNLWGDYGYCTTEAGINDNCIVDFGYSHGSDPKPGVLNSDFDYIETWKKATLSSQKELVTFEANSKKGVSWNWRQDFIDEDDTFRDDLADGNAPECENYDFINRICADQNSDIKTFYYTLSTGVKGDGDNYIVESPDPEGGNENVDPAYFRNPQRYTRSQRLRTDPVPVSYFYYTRSIDRFPGHEYCLGVPCNFPIDELRREFFQETIREIVTGPDIFERTGMDHFIKNEFGSDILSSNATISEWNINSSGSTSLKTSARPQFLATVAKNSAGINMGLEMAPSSGMQLMGFFPESTQNITYNLVKMDPGSNGDWRTVGVLSNLPDYFNPVNSVYHNGDLFVISREVVNAAVLKKIYIINPISLNGNTCTGSNNIYKPVFINDLPNISNASLYSFTGGLYIVGEGGNGMEIHKLADQNGDYYTVNITGTAMPSLRDTYTVTVKDDVLYLAGRSGCKR